MIVKGSAVAIGLALGTIPAAAQTAGPPAAPSGTRAEGPAEPDDYDAFDEEADEQIVVTGERERGSVVGNVQPELQLRAADIRAYGVSSVSELVTELSAETNGTPVVLLNGKRIASFSEIRDLPTEAISRVEILPEEVALSYGYAANQKVVNIVLRQRFRAETSEVRAGITTEGDRENGRLQAGLLRIRGDNRMTLDVQLSAASRLLESQRDILPTSSSRAYALGGNVTAPGGGEIDPALSALAGEPVTVAAVPASAATGAPGLSAFLPGANRPAVSDLGDVRTLSPSTRNLAINAGLARVLPGDIAASVTARFETGESRSLRGLPGVTFDLPAGSPWSPFDGPVQVNRYLDGIGPLEQRNTSRSGELGVTLSGMLSTWQWSFTGGWSLSSSRTATDRGVDVSSIQAALDAGDPTVNPFGAIAPSLLGAAMTDRARASSSNLNGDFLLSGSPFTLPAGKATASFRVGAARNGVESRSVRRGIVSETDYARSIVSGQASLDLPIASRRNGVLDAIGDLALNGNAAVEHLSDFGALTTFGYGLRWTPIPAVRLIVSRTHDESAPAGQQIDSPLLVTPNVPVFDYRTGETVFVSEIGGGNPLLRTSDRRLTRIGLTLRPFDKTNLTLTANYTHSRTDNPVAAFPTPTPQIEAAFPDRFLRDAEGRLVQVDARPLNFASASRSQLRWGFNLSLPIKSAMQKRFEAWREAGGRPEDRPADLRGLFGGRGDRDGRRGEGRDGDERRGQEDREGQPGGDGAGERRDGQADAPGAGAGAAGMGEGRRGGGGQGFGRFGGGRRFGGERGGGGGRLQFSLYHTWHLTDRIVIDPSVPVLDLLDGAAIGSSGGQPRHEVEARFGYSNNGLGARLSASWQSGTRVDGALGAAGSTLRFDDIATFDLRLFADLGRMPSVVRAVPFLRRSRVTFSIDNLFNARQTVTDATGATPLRYQPAYLDPLGRTISVSFRKLF